MIAAIVILVSVRAYTLLVRTEAPFFMLSLQYGINVDSTVDSDFFPEDWQQPPINARALPISEVELRRFPRLLKIALAKYPPEVISQNLKTVCLAHAHYFYDTPYGGTYSTETIYLTSKGWTQGFTDQYLVGMFHAEFSSILMRNYPFPRARWLACNPIGFKYRNDDPDEAGREAITQHRAGLHGNARLYRDGFLSEYSLANIEEDINEFSASILGRPQETRMLIEQHPRLKMKYHVWLDFYHSINAKMTESFLLDGPNGQP